MGNSFFCKRCDIEKFQLSEACADQLLTEGENQTPEDHWLKKLKCLDDAHSKYYGISPENLDHLLEEVEKELKLNTIPLYCRNKDLVVECLRRNPNCMLNCQREMDDFIDCVDTNRVKKIKERIQQSMKPQHTDLSALFT